MKKLQIKVNQTEKGTLYLILRPVKKCKYTLKILFSSTTAGSVPATLTHRARKTTLVLLSYTSTKAHLSPFTTFNASQRKRKSYCVFPIIFKINQKTTLVHDKKQDLNQNMSWDKINFSNPLMTTLVITGVYYTAL